MMRARSNWTVVPDPNDPEMLAVQGVYLVADNLPIEDAALIAAAPDMYEALHNATSLLRALLTPDDPVVLEALAAADTALAKATGGAS